MSGFKSEDFYRRTYERAERERRKAERLAERYTKGALGSTLKTPKVPNYALPSFYTPKISNYGIASFNVPKPSDYIVTPYLFGSLDRKRLLSLQNANSLVWNNLGIRNASITSSAVTNALKILNAQVPRISASIKNSGGSELGLGVRQTLQQTQLGHLQSHFPTPYLPRVRLLPYVYPPLEDREKAAATTEPETEVECVEGEEDTEFLDEGEAATTPKEPLYPKTNPYASLSEPRDPFARSLYEYVMERREAIVVAVFVGIVSGAIGMVTGHIIIMYLL